MQSQQKRVKWSRGETAEALEERTDTGITQASVELMENCIPDIYGNVSRRPALKILPYDDSINSLLAFNYDPHMQVIPFYITENDYIIIAIHGNSNILEAIRIKDNVRVYEYLNSSSGISNRFHEDLVNGTVSHHPLSFAQQNNYLLIAAENKIYKIQANLSNQDNSFTLLIDTFGFVAGWYAPEGTKTKTIDNQTQVRVVVSGVETTVTLSGLEFNSDGAGFISHIASLSSNPQLTKDDTVNYSAITTNLANTEANLAAINKAIAVGSIVQFPNNGAYMRVEGYYVANSKIMMYGALLTPVADDSGKDTSVVVEYGYVRMYPNPYFGDLYPHPTQLLFLDQRLWAGDWLYGLGTESTGSYALTWGSQIAKYNDFKNDYNQENEAIMLDILTQYKEKILHLVDYNGLKIMTDSYEYSYEGGQVIKQSGNGSFRDCKPIVFESLCLYCDSTGHQIKAMQYEFQANIFNSSTVNTVAPHDLVWYPFCMAAYEDKVNSTGKYIFLVNKDEEGYPRLAVCNFVPGNQANIWCRWSLATTIKSRYRENVEVTPAVYIENDNTPIVQGCVNLKTGVLFLMTINYEMGGNEKTVKVVPAVLDFNGNADCEEEPTLINGVYYYAFNKVATNYLLFRNTDVVVYADGVFKWYDKTTNTGALTRDISGLTNVTVGLPINAQVISHPIDVGGKTKSVKKRIGKAQVSVHDTAAGAITINGKTGYMNPSADHICFYGVTGMKDEIKYTITNNNGAMFHLESLLMNVEYGTLDS